MPQMYIIYVKDSIIRIDEGEENPADRLQTADGKDDSSRVIAKIHAMLGSDTMENLTVISADPKKLIKKLQQQLVYIKAAGGLIRNDAGEYLFIFRRGKWDLPKGKLEPEEKAEQAAVREVEEECGLKISLVKRELDSTYHIYEQDGEFVLKRTCWYLMKSRGDQALVPQLEEEITEVRWFKTDELQLIRQNTYLSVLQVMQNIPQSQLN